ncbi:hypothetical protein MD484_g9044, partial [Candolleomyces efflorescens]
MSARGGSVRGTPPPRSHSQSTSRSSSSASSRGQGDDDNTPRPEDRAQRPHSRHPSVQRTRYARTTLPAADRELPPSSDDPLASPVFVPEPSPAPAGTSRSAVLEYMQTAYNTQGEGGSWADDDVGMDSLPPSGAPSREGTVPRSLRSSGKQAQQAREDPYPSALNVRESLRFVTQWLMHNEPPQIGDDIQWNDATAIEGCLHDLAHALRTTGWANVVSQEDAGVIAGGQSEDDQTVRTPLPPGMPRLPPDDHDAPMGDAPSSSGRAHRGISEGRPPSSPPSQEPPEGQASPKGLLRGAKPTTSEGRHLLCCCQQTDFESSLPG